MITQYIYDIVWNFLFNMFELLPEFGFELPTEALKPALQFVSLAGYLLPMETILTIFQIIVYLAIFRLIIALVKTIYDFIPFA